MKSKRNREIPMCILTEHEYQINGRQFEKWLVDSITKHCEQHDLATENKDLIRIGSHITTLHQVLDNFRKKIKII